MLAVLLGIFNQSFYLNCEGLHSFTCFFIIYKINKDGLPLPMLRSERRSSERGCSHRETENLGVLGFCSPESSTPS